MLALSRITRTFGANRAVDDVSLSISAGEIVGLVGENGAGKTTLMRIAAGELAPDAGVVDRGGAVELVHQHFMLVPDFTIAENLALTRSWRFASRRTLNAEAERLIAASGIALPDVSRRVGDLSVGEKAKLELIKAIARQPRVLILDEPTSVLTPSESSELFAVIRSLASSGTAVVFISHKLPEVLAVAQRVVVMRRGRVIVDDVAHGFTPDELASAMLEVEDRRSRLSVPKGQKGQAGLPVLHFDHVSGDVLAEISFDVRRGEIVAIVGVAGNGQGELAALLRGLSHPKSGTIQLDAAHTGHIPEDRTRDGIVAEMSIAENLALTAKRWRPREAARHAAQLISLYNIRAQGPAQKAGSLSGGNQQKVILARELDRRPELIVAAEPTRGLDIEATRYVHDQLRAAAGAGAAIVLITSDLDEAFALADAMHVIYRGRLSDRLTPAEASARVANLMAGVA